MFDLDDKSEKGSKLRGERRRKRNKNKNVGGKQNIQEQKHADKSTEDHEDTNKYIKEIMKEYKVEMNGFVDNISSTSEPKLSTVHKQENKQINVDDDSMKILTTKITIQPISLKHEL